MLILTENTPFALVAPATLIDFYQTMEDYAFGFWGASLIRLLRFGGWALTLFLPSIYIAVIAVNPEMVPSELYYRAPRYFDSVDWNQLFPTVPIEFSVTVQVNRTGLTR